MKKTKFIPKMEAEDIRYMDQKLQSMVVRGEPKEALDKVRNQLKLMREAEEIYQKEREKNGKL